MYKVGVLGDKESVLGFKVLGIETFIVDDANLARPVLRRIAREGYAVIYVTEHIARGIEEEIESYKDSITPAIIIIPGKGGPMGLGMMNLKHAVERAVGANILDT